MCTERALIALLALSATPAAAATPTVVELREEARSLLQSICGWQCDVVDVRIKPKAVAPVGAVAPGFDDTPAARTVAGSVDVTLLLDAALAPSLRAFVIERVRTRLSEMGLPVTVTERVQPFPPRPSVTPQDPVPTPPPAPSAAPAAPTIVIPPAPAAAPIAPAPAPEKPPALDRLIDRLIEALPLLLLAALLVWAVLRVLSRYEAMLTAPPPEEPAAQAPPPAPRPPVPAPDAAAIGALLAARRPGTRRIFDRLLRAGEDELVARAVARFGPSLLADLAADAAHAPALARAGRRAAEILRSEPGPDDDREALRALEAELVADRVAFPTEPVPAPLEPVLALGPEGFAALADALGGRRRAVLLKHGPADLTTSYLGVRAAEDRAALARELALAAPATREELEGVAEAVGALLPTAALAAGESERLADLMDTLSADDQEALVAALARAKPELIARAGGRLPVESALTTVPDAALARAFDAVGVTTWATYLRAAPEAIRQRALAACPARLLPALQEELALRVAVDGRGHAVARRAVIRAALEAARAGGADDTTRPGLASARPVAHARVEPNGGPRR